MRFRPFSLLALAATLGLIMMVAGSVLAHRSGPLQILYPLGALLVGGLLYSRRPALYVGFTWWIWFLTPEVRRLVDWQTSWHPQSTVMLAPFLVTGLTFFTLVRHSPKLQFFPLLPIGMVLVGLLYGFCVGVLNVGVSGAVFDLLSWLVPVMLAFYVVVRWRDYPDFRRVTRSTFLWGLLVMGLYGLQQFLDPPIWDQIWMRNAPINSIGAPEPFEVRVYSTLNSPGPFAVVVMAGLLLLLGGGGLRSWPALGVGFASFLLSLVRSAWGILLIGLYFLAAHRGRSRPRLLATLVVAGLVVWPLLSFGPIADAIGERLQTFNQIEQDQSFGDRLRLYSDFAPRAFLNPLGEGLGSTGVSTKLSNEGGALGQLGDLDSGIMAIPFTLGWLGALLYVGGLVWLSLYALRSIRRPDLFAAACRGIAAGMLAQLVFGNATSSVPGMVLWYFLGLTVAARLFHNRRDADEAVGQKSLPKRPAQSSVA